jgi:uncharacterized membrane protein
MLYLWLKLIHIISSTILFGTGIGTAATMLYGHYKQKIKIIATVNKYVVLADWIFTATSSVIQPITGIAMVLIIGHSFTSLWIMGSIFGYSKAGCC